MKYQMQKSQKNYFLSLYVFVFFFNYNGIPVVRSMFACEMACKQGCL